MKETGVVRKLDNLGRLVIPKEIRRCMRIKEGSPIEFGLLPSGEIVLCKYSLVNQISDFAEDFCDILGEIFDCTVIIGDRDKVLTCYNISKKTMIGLRFSNEILDIIDAKNCYMANIQDSTTIIPIVENDKFTYLSELVYPIVIQGEVEGVIIMCSGKDSTTFGNDHMQVLKLVSKFLSKQME